jgi:hypothetical protein
VPRSGTTWGRGQTGNPNGRPRAAVTKQFVERDLARGLHRQEGLDLMARCREHEHVGVQELLWIVRQRENIPAKLGAIGLLFDRSRGRPSVAVDLNAEVNGQQLSLFAHLGIPDDDVPILQSELLKAIEVDKQAQASPAPESEAVP